MRSPMDRFRADHPTLCRLRGHSFRHNETRHPDCDTTVIIETCPCGAKVEETRRVIHGRCPDCGGEVEYDPSRPKTYVGTDTYCDENLYGEWICRKCGRASDEDFRGDYEQVERHLVISGRRR